MLRISRSDHLSIYSLSIMSEMKDSRLYTRSLLLCNGFTTVLYIVVGTVVSRRCHGNRWHRLSKLIHLSPPGLLLLWSICRLARSR